MTKQLLVVGGRHSGKRYALLHGKTLRVPTPIDLGSDVWSERREFGSVDYEKQTFYTSVNGSVTFLVPIGQAASETLSLLVAAFEEKHR